MARTILVIDDENNMRWVLKQAFGRAGYEVLTASRGDEGLQLFARRRVDLVLLDLKMPGMDGLSLLRELRNRDAEMPILLFTAYATVATAVEALKVGATDYIRKPFDIEEVLTKISHYLRTTQQLNSADLEPTRRPGFQEFVGASPALHTPLAQAAAAAESEYTVVLCGESGSGRRHLARLIHQHSGRGRLVTIDCASLPPALLQRELLEQLPNADEIEPKEVEWGYWQQALGGTLLLANSDVPPPSLVEPLVTQLSKYLRSRQRPHGLRLFLTTTQTLNSMWQPLLQTAIQIELPPLRQRLADLPLFLAHFAPGIEWEPAARAQLRAYHWPGNVAELKRIVKQVAPLATPLATEGPVRMEHLPSHILPSNKEQTGTTTALLMLPSEGIDLEDLEKNLIRQALARTEGNKAGAARLLGLTRATLLYRLDKYNIGYDVLKG